LPDSTRIGYVHLRVADLQRSLSFYRDLLGLTERKRDGSTVSLSASRTGDLIVVLTENRDAKPRPPHSTGLFHTAIVMPTREEGAGKNFQEAPRAAMAVPRLC
jgi:catechol 2,3-dioxygenase